MDVYIDAKPNLLMDAVLWPVKFQSGNGTHQWAEDESLDTIAAFRVDWIQKHKRFLDSYFENMNEEQRHRVDVTPGLTGLAQAKGRNNISIFEKIN